MSSRRVLLVFSRLVMEGAWLTALVAFSSLLTGAPQSAMPALAVYGLVVFAYGAGYVLQHLELSLAQLRLIGLFLAMAVVNGVAKLLVTGHGDFWNVGWPFDYVGGGAGAFDQGRQTILALGLGVVLWWRGTRLAEGLPTFGGVVAAFRSGVILVGLQGILEGFVPMADGASAMTVPFFMGGLLALVLAHLERVDRSQAIEFKGAGILVPLATIGAIGVLGVLFGLLPYGEMGRILATLGEVVNLATTYALFTFFLGAGLLAEFLINFLNWLLSFLERTPISFTNPLTQNMLEALQQPGETGGATWFLDLARNSILVVLLLIALTFLALAFRRRQKEREDAPEEARTSLWAQASERSDLPAWLQRLLSGLLSKGQFGIPPGLEGILRLYFWLLQWAAGAGVVREPWRTPLEFQGTLEKAFGAREGEVGRITRAFMEARYGHRVPTASALSLLEADFQRLRGQPEAPRAPSEGS